MYSLHFTKLPRIISLMISVKSFKLKEANFFVIQDSYRFIRIYCCGYALQVIKIEHAFFNFTTIELLWIQLIPQSPFSYSKNWITSNIQKHFDNLDKIKIQLSFHDHFTWTGIKSSITVCENFKTDIFHKIYSPRITTLKIMRHVLVCIVNASLTSSEYWEGL